MDLRPVTPGHLLMVPQSPAERLTDLPDGLGARVWKAGHRPGRALRLSVLRSFAAKESILSWPTAKRTGESTNST